MPPSTTPLISPLDRRLDEVVAATGVRGDARNVIRLVETWAQGGTPTRRARYWEAKAFHTLRLMDRAMARAREIVENHPEDLETQQLLSEIYIDRGWPSHAKKILTALREHGNRPELESLWARAQQEPVRLGSQTQQIEASGDPVRLLALAEYFLTTGSFFRARSILERMRRMDPDSRRVQDLLWGLDGVFTSREVSTDKLLAELSPIVPSTALPEESEHTESARMEGGDEASTSFPALFKHAARQKRAIEPDEHTSISPLATPEQMATLSEATDPGMQISAVSAPIRHEDTQIMLVLRAGEGQRPRPMHRKKEEDNLRETLNLREWQQSMGVAPAPTDLPPETERPEEDENVVLLQRSPPTTPLEPEPTESRKRPIEVIEKIPSPPPLEAKLETPEEEPHDLHEEEPPSNHPNLTVTPILIALGIMVVVTMLAIGGLLLYLGR